MIALIVWAVLATIVAAVALSLNTGAASLLRSERASFGRELASVHASLDRQVKRREEEHGDHVAILSQRELQHAAYIHDREAQHTAEIDRLNAIHASALERLMNMQQFGSTSPKEAVVTAPEPDAETRVLRRISEDSIEAGAAALKQMYDDAGIPVSLEEVRDEAHSMLLGLSPKVNPSRALIPRED